MVDMEILMETGDLLEMAQDQEVQIIMITILTNQKNCATNAKAVSLEAMIHKKANLRLPLRRAPSILPKILMEEEAEQIP